MARGKGVAQSVDDLRVHLKEQIGFLWASCKAYDEGKESEHKRLAATIRLLVHETSTSRSRSLIKQVRNVSLLFYSTAHKLYRRGEPVPDDDITKKLKEEGIIPRNLGYVCSYQSPALVMQSLTASGLNPSIRWLPLLDNANPGNIKKVPFDDWWNMVAVIDDSGQSYTRKDLVLYVCDKDGGAHVDPEISKQYAQLSRNTTGALGLTATVNGINIIACGLVGAAIRQIAYEVLKTLKDEFPEYF